MTRAIQTSAPKRVLIVEDDPAVTALLARALRNRGYAVETRASPHEAMLCAATFVPQAALVDLKLGANSGLDLVSALVKRYTAMRIVMLTGYASIATAVRAIKLGASDYLSKPANIEDIVTALGGGRSPAAPPPVSIPTLRRLEWEHIQRVLAENAGNISESARVLGMQRRTLQRKLAKRPVKK